MDGEGVLVALTASRASPDVLHRGAALATAQGARLVGVHVHTPGEPATRPATIEEQRAALEDLGGRYLEVSGDDVAGALIRVASSEGLGQIVVGAGRRRRWAQLRGGTLVDRLTQRSPVDVHVVGGPAASRRPVARGGSSRLPPLERGRRVAGWVLAAVLPALTTFVLVAADRHVDLAAQLVVMLLAVLVAAAVGGLGPGAAAALWANLLANWWFIPPVDGLSISRGEDALALVAFLLVALVIGGAVSTGARRAAEAARARADAAALATLAGTAAGSDDAVPALLEQLRVAVGATAASLRVRSGPDTVDEVTDAVGPAASADPTGPALDGSAPRTDGLELPLDDGSVVVLDGGEIRGLDPDVTAAFLDQLSLAVEHRRLRAAEDDARRVAEVNELRATLLAAVSHDLRTPLATMKASSSALVQLGDELDAGPRAELAATLDAGVDRLTALVTNLLGMSRIRAGAVDLDLRPVSVDEVVHRAAIGVVHRGVALDVDLDDDLPAVVADGALLEHVVANLLDNACKWSPVTTTVRVTANLMPAPPDPADTLVLQIVDHGSGIPAEHRQRIRQAFERVHVDDGPGDTAEVEGTGLGLSVATGFCSLMGISLLLAGAGDDDGCGRRVADGTTASLFIPLAESAGAGGGGR